VQFRFEVSATPPSGWTVEVLDDTIGGPLKDANGAPITHQMVPLGRDPTYPQREPGSGVPTDLGSATDVATIRRVHESIVARTPAGSDLERFGRYLFEMLIGAETWKTILGTAGLQPIELMLSWSPDQAVLNRLPWELIHNGARFLTQEPGVAIVRRVAGAAQPMPDLSSPPKVLFVVGTELYKDVIESGAEYLRLIQGLKARDLDLSLRSLLVLRCTSERLLAALEEFSPNVVHFICHGRLDQDGKCYLELVDSKVASKSAPLYSQALVTMLSGLKKRPSIVVLSACYTATTEFTDVGQVAVPLAADLIQNGVPIVVGMGGRVSDQACRLFTRRFYESLLTDGDVAHATAEGRRAAISHGGMDPASSADWALPVICFAGGVATTRLPITLQAADQAWQRCATDFRNQRDPAFCDRLEIMEQFDTLMADEGAQRRVGGRDMDLQVLAIEVPQPDSADKYGRTWLLHELAVKAIQDGHVPCLVCKGETWQGDAPGDVIQLLEAIEMAVDNTRYRFDLTGTLPFACPLVRSVWELGSGTLVPADLPQEIQSVSGEEATRGVRRKAVALRLDLLALLDAAAALRPPADAARTKLVLLIDDLHRMGHPAVSDLLLHLCGTTGLRAARSRVRAVVTYSSQPLPGQEPSVKAVTDLLKPWTKRVELGRFRPKLEERQAYQHYLLHWRDGDRLRPLVVEGQRADWVFGKLERAVRGIPSNLILRAPLTVDALLDTDADVTLLREADDLAVLAVAKDNVRT
jgi:hypothetical protein